MRSLPGPGDFSPPDPKPSVYDSAESVMDVLIDAGIPDYLADQLADLATRGWSDEAWAEAKVAIQRHVEPLVAEADARSLRMAA